MERRARGRLAAGLVGAALAGVLAWRFAASPAPPAEDADAGAPPLAAGDAGAPPAITASAAPTKAPLTSSLRVDGFTWLRRIDAADSRIGDAAAQGDGVIVTGRPGADDASFGALKIGAAGAIWDRRFGRGIGSAVAAGGGRIAVLGERGESADGGRATRPFIAVLDDAGAILWSKSMGEMRDSPGAVALTPDGGVVAAFTRFGPKGQPPGVVIALDPKGALRWEALLGGGEGLVRPSSLAVDAAGNAILGGSFSGAVKLGETTYRAPSSAEIAFAAKLGPSGAIAWVATLGQVSLRINPAKVAVDGAGTVVAIAMQDNGEAPSDTPPSFFTVTKLDPAGKVIFQRRLGNDTWAEGVVIERGGEITIAGQFAGAVDFGAGVLRGRGDGFVVRLDAEGRTLASRRVPEIHGIPVLGDDGSVLLAGERRIGTYGDRTPVIGELAPAAPAAAPEPPIQKPSLAIHQFFRLNRARDGLDGRLLLLQDSRMNKEDHDAACFLWTPLEGLGERFDSPPLTAAVRLVDEGGKELQSLPLDHPLAKIDVWDLYGDGRPSYLVVENDSICAGSWRGLLTTLVEVREGRLVKLGAVDPQGRPASMRFNLGLRGEVRLVPARSGRGKDIHYARSGFAAGAPDEETRFETRLSRFSFEDGRWVRRERAIPVNWMFGDGGPGSFPDRNEFP